MAAETVEIKAPETRTSVRFLPAEIRALREMSDREGVKFNALIRIAVRRLLGLPNPEWTEEL